MGTFHNLRNVLGYSVLCYGTTLLFTSRKNNFIYIILGITWIILSLFLHKSMFLYIIIMGLSLIPLNKKYIILSLLFFPIIYNSVTYISEFILTNSFADETSQQSGENYLNSELMWEVNIYGMLRLIIERLPIFIFLFYSIKHIYFKKEHIQYSLKIFLQYSYWLIYISYLFRGQSVSSYLTNRFWDAALFPFTIFLSAYLYQQPRTPFIKKTFYLLIIANLYTLTYILYKTL